MGKIFCLMGKSSSGKDTIYKLLLEKEELHLKKIIPYTTRPIRVGETQGVEYHFVEEQELKQIENSGKLIELRCYETIHGIWKYFTVDDSQINLSINDYLMIGTLESYQKIQQYFGEKAVVPVFIDLEDDIRLQRALDREKMQDHPRYDEMCRRFLADTKDFGEEKMKEARIEKKFLNQDLQKCLNEIINFIVESIK